MSRKYQPKLLSDFDAGELEAGAHQRGIPKWSTLCLLRMLQLPTLQAMLLEPGTAMSTMSKSARAFGKRVGRKELMVRSDGGQERTQYLRGGNTLPLRDAVSLAHRQLSLGRHVIFLEPTNRFTNELSFNCLLSNDGAVTIECLGPGYDVSDLNRGGVLPRVTISGAFKSLLQFEPMRPWDLSTIIDRTTPIAKRRRMRLLNIAQHILPGIGVRVRGEPASFAEEWLKRRGFIDLWNADDQAPGLARVLKWTEAAFAVGHWMNHQGYAWSVLVLSGSVLENGRMVYWDVVEGSMKWRISSNSGVQR